MAVDAWSVIKAVFEPSLVAFILGFGVFLNRKLRLRLVGENRLSYLINRYPFVLEIVYLLLTYWIYELSRLIALFLPAIHEGSIADTAQENAISLINFEKSIGLFHELDLQHFFLQRPILLGIINRVYSYIHIPGTCTFFVWFFKTQKFENYAPVRRALSVGNWIAFLVFTFWPCMPPRFLSEYGFIDTVHVNGNSSVWTTNSLTNQYAAMPSLHFGYSFFIGLNIIRYGAIQSDKRWYWRTFYFIFGVFYPSLLLVAIVGTGNHFFLDAVVGGILILIALLCNRFILVFYPLQVKLFRVLKIRNPHDEDDGSMQMKEQTLPLFNPEVVPLE